MSLDGPPVVMGDKSSLSLDELNTLENRVLPTARHWASEIPGLRGHGVQTLEYWGEPVPPLRKRGRYD